MMGEWAVGHWIVGVTSFQKIYGLYSVEHHKMEKWSYYVGCGWVFWVGSVRDAELLSVSEKTNPIGNTNPQINLYIGAPSTPVENTNPNGNTNPVTSLSL